MVNTFYRGSVKNLLGPIEFHNQPSMIFHYSDAYSVFDWGKMPDSIPEKGKSLCQIGAYFFEKMKKPESWVDFSKSKEALELRKGVVKISTDKVGSGVGGSSAIEASISSLGSLFNEMGEDLKKNGLRTHYLGLIEEFQPQKYNAHENIQLSYLETLKKPTEYMLVESFPAIAPEFSSVLGRVVPDYKKSRSFSGAKLIPLEFVFRFSCPPGSSFLERVKKNPDILNSLALPLTEDKQLDLNAGEWGFPVLECFSKLEPKDRFLTFSEAQAYTSLTGVQFQELLLKTAWVAGFIKNEWARLGIQCADGKLEWGVNEAGELYLVDHISIDELRLLKDGVQLSKEFLREFYRGTQWYDSVQKAQKWAQERGISDWKSKVRETPPQLPEEWKNTAAALYATLSKELTSSKTKVQGLVPTISIEELVQKIREIQTK